MSFKGSEWKEKAETLELELQQCYKAQARLSEQLVVEVAESRGSKDLVEEKEALIIDLQKECSQARSPSPSSSLNYKPEIIVNFKRYVND